MIAITIDGLHPYMRYARHIDIGDGYGYNNIIAYDARMLYIETGVGCITIDGARYPLAPGTLLCWQPGSEYAFGELSDEGLGVIMVNFDFKSEAPTRSLIHPVKSGQFDSSRLDFVCSFTENADSHGVFYDRTAFSAEASLRELIGEYNSRRIYSDVISSGIMQKLLAGLSRSMHILISDEDEHSDEIIAYIRTHLGERITYDSLAAVFNYHPNHLSRIISRATGLPLHKYLTKLRIERAYGLLADSQVTVSQAAIMCGFNDPSSFARRFRIETGISPSDISGKK